MEKFEKVHGDTENHGRIWGACWYLATFFSNPPANGTLCKLAMLAPGVNHWFVYSNQATTSPSGKSSKAKTPNPLFPLFTEIFSKPFAPNPSSHRIIRHASRPPPRGTRGTRGTRGPWHHVAHSTRAGTNAARCGVAWDREVPRERGKVGLQVVTGPAARRDMRWKKQKLQLS